MKLSSGTALANQFRAPYSNTLVEQHGRHWLVARLRDSDRTEGLDYESAAEGELAPDQDFVVDFRSETGGFIFM